MRVFARLETLVLAVLCLPFATLATAGAQEHGLRPPSVQGTISVADLRVLPQAREHLEKARQAAQKQRDDVCEREIAKALAISPDFPEAYILMADRDNKASRYEAAIEHALRAQALDPGDPWPPLLLATTYNGQGRYNDAFLLLSNLHGEAARVWQAQYEMARSEVGRGDVDGALHWSELALASAPANWGDRHLIRANALQLARRWREATREIECFLASEASPARRTAIATALNHIELLAEEQESEERGKLAVREQGPAGP